MRNVTVSRNTSTPTSKAQATKSSNKSNVTAGIGTAKQLPATQVVQQPKEAALFTKLLDQAEAAFENGQSTVCVRWCTQVLERGASEHIAARAQRLLARCAGAAGDVLTTLKHFELIRLRQG